MVPLSRRLDRVITKSICLLFMATSTERTTGRIIGKGRKEGGMVESKREKETDAVVVRDRGRKVGWKGRK